MFTIPEKKQEKKEEKGRKKGERGKREKAKLILKRM